MADHKHKVSKKQMRAMGAAAGGRSTLGIPRVVGKKFLAHKKAGRARRKG